MRHGRRKLLVGCMILGSWLTGCNSGTDTTEKEPSVREMPTKPAVPVKPINEPVPPVANEPLSPSPTLPARDPNPPSKSLASPSQERPQSPSEPVAQLPPRTVVPAASPEANPSTQNPGTTKVAKQREPLFDGWQKPQLALVITGRQNGYIEPCGCTGLANQKGGLARRHAFFQMMKERGWPIAAVDVGNQVKRFGRQSEIKFQIAFEGLKQMDYRAIGLGPEDLRLSSGELVAAISDQPSRFVCANVAVLDPELTAKFQVIEQGGRKIGVTAILGEEYRKHLQNDELISKPAEAALREVLPKMTQAGCELKILLAYTTLDESRQLAKQFPDFPLIVTAGGAEEPAFEPEIVEGTKSRLIQVGSKGMYVGVLGMFDDANQPWRYQRVPLDDRFADSPAMLKLLKDYQAQLENAGLNGLGVKPVKHPSESQFVGSEKCGDCHTKAMAVWKQSPHAHATESLVHPPERRGIARHFDPECLSCHVTGWEPQKIFPFASGYLGLKQSPHLHGSGCENCHGPGSAHVAAENGEGNPTDALRDQLRNSMKLPLAQAQNKCIECHDIDNSPAFHAAGAFEQYWKRVAHPGKD